MILRGRKAFFWGQFFDEPRVSAPVPVLPTAFRIEITV